MPGKLKNESSLCRAFCFRNGPLNCNYAHVLTLSAGRSWSRYELPNARYDPATPTVSELESVSEVRAAGNGS
jgi:hypothetical protein